MISLIVAVSKNNVIGNNGIIPWKIKGEQRRFKELMGKYHIRITHMKEKRSSNLQP